MSKRRVLVVGGKDYNVPSWARRAFVIDLIDAEAHGGNSSINPPRADCIVVQVNYVSHNFSGQAHELGRKWKVPVLKARDGWSSAVAHAARNKVDWFVDAVQLAGQQLIDEDEEAAEEAIDVVDNAWKETALYEREKATGAERRMAKLEGKLDKVAAAYDRVRSGAEARIITAINQRSAEAERSRGSDLDWTKLELKEMREAAEALLYRIQRLEQGIRNEVASPPPTD